MIDKTVLIQGHASGFATVDLTVTPAEIRAQLLFKILRAKGCKPEVSFPRFFVCQRWGPC
jgi:hypothetical protein